MKAALKLLSAVAMVWGMTGLAAAQEYPTREITLMAPYPPGALTDGVARLLQPKISEHLGGATILIDNKAGAGGALGVGQVARAKPDGYTLVMVVNAPIVMAPSLQASLPYDPRTDLKGIGVIAETYLTLAVPADSPIKTIDDVIRLAKEQPGKLTFGSAGIGSAHHIAGEVLNKNAGIQVTHIPFQGGGPAIQNLVGKQLDMSYGTLPTVHNFVESGDLRIIAMAESKRVASHPDVPLINETVPGVETTTWLGFFAPAGTPDDIVAKLNEALNFGLAQPDVQESMARLGLVVRPSTPAELDELVAKDLDFWANAVATAGIEKQ
jgi:tripartite-type tricarboxylate transporter receptor subunit TctC